VNDVLLKNQDNLDRILQLFAPFTRQFADVTGTGRWFDSWIQNLIPIPASVQLPQNGGTSTPNQGGQTANPLPFLP
jgi:phospholipid/cholesterol/gamma-HCH transport system substrate-binding protein